MGQSVLKFLFYSSLIVAGHSVVFFIAFLEMFLSFVFFFPHRTLLFDASLAICDLCYLVPCFQGLD